MEIENHFVLMLRKKFSVLEKDGVFNGYANGIVPNQIGKDYYITNKNKGLGFVLDQTQKLCAIHFYNTGKDGSEGFQGNLPFNVSFMDSEGAIREKLGEWETISGGGHETMLLGKINRWIRYNFAENYLRFEFDPNGVLVLITLAVAD